MCVCVGDQVRAGEDVVVDDSEDPLAEIMALWSQPFLPNLLNTVTFLVETAQIIAVLFVNYKGRPWMVGGVKLLRSVLPVKS
eukprot:SAG31_NODE_40_length_31360_cov_6.751575_9_plen_82_part_00